jgi:hypothetical protein
MNRNERDDLGTMNDRKHIRHHDQAGVPRADDSCRCRRHGARIPPNQLNGCAFDLFGLPRRPIVFDL